MVDDEVLARWLDGSQGVEGLDLAREVVAGREQVRMLVARNAELLASAQANADAAEVAIGRAGAAEAKLKALAEGFAQTSAELREWLEPGG